MYQVCSEIYTNILYIKAEGKRLLLIFAYVNIDEYFIAIIITWRIRFCDFSCQIRLWFYKLT